MEGDRGTYVSLQALHTPAPLVTRLAYRSRETLRIPVSASQALGEGPIDSTVSCRYIGWLVRVLETAHIRSLRVFQPYRVLFIDEGRPVRPATCWVNAKPTFACSLRVNEKVVPTGALRFLRATLASRLPSRQLR
jgi:hypothetical protein